MLSRWSVAGAAALLVLLRPVLAQDDADGLRRPERVTIGTSDQYLGQLSPDGKTVYFASNRNTTTEIFRQNLESGSAKLLFDEGADVSWPRISPDGQQLLYVSLRQDAAGQLCVRRVPDKDRRCLAAASGALQAQWINAKQIVLLSRPAAQGDIRLSLVDVGGKPTARTLFDRNLTAPTVSPNGRWLVYTPVERFVEKVGPAFAARAGHKLMAQRFDRLETKPTAIALDAPGLTAQAAFDPDGKWLYFVQFVSDTNQDGVIDGNDHGVLFRVPFDSTRDDAPARLADVTPEQLTDASWNCQYPSPSRDKLLATCSTKTGRLDIYELAKSGVVPPEWDEARLRAELDVTTSPAEALLLHGRLLTIEREPSERRSEMVTLIRLHLGLGQFDPADFFAQKVAALKDKSTAGLGSTMRMLCEHRRALRARERGRLSLDFAEDSRERMEKLAQSKATSPAGVAMRHILRSEIADVLGDKELAQKELAEVVLDEVTLPAIVELYVDRADALYRQLDERAPLIAALRRAAQHPALTVTERMSYARSAARTLRRGLPRAEAETALEAARAAEPAGSDLAFAFELQSLLLGIERDEPPPEIREKILALYRRDDKPERRRAVMVDGVQRGSECGAERFIAELAALYVDDAPKGTIERRRAARLYKRLLEDRAYADLRAGHTAEARDAFFAVAKKVGSLESWTGYIDRRLSEDAKPEEVEADIAKWAGPPTKPVGRYARAYLIARRLPRMKGEEAEAAMKQGIALLRGGWSELNDKPEAVAVYGALLHERFLHNDDRADALRASGRYLIALDLARRNPRYRSMLLGQMALLQAQVGNWRIALDYFEQREKLPFVDNAAGIAHKLVKARTLLHLDDEEGAATLADEALVAVDKNPKLEKYRAMVLDRAALYNLAASRFERAQALYDRLLPLVEKQTGAAAQRNVLVGRLARAAAALGNHQPKEALTVLRVVDELLAEPNIGKVLRWPHATEWQTVWSYRQIAFGLRAKAHLQRGDQKDAAAALEQRRALYDELHKRGGEVEDHVRARALVEAELAELALGAGQGAAALTQIGLGLDHLEAAQKKAGKLLDHDQLTLLWLAAESRFSTDAKVKLSLRARLATAIDVLQKQPDAKWRTMQRWFEIYLGMLGKARAKQAGVGAPVDGTKG